MNITESERFLAGVCLLGEGPLDEVESLVSVGDFTQFPLRLVFETATRLRGECHRVDAASVLSELQRAGQAKDLGESPALYLADLLSVAGSGAGLEYHGKILQESSKRRKLNALGHRLAVATADPHRPVEDIQSEFEAELLKVDQHGSDGPVDSKSIVHETFNLIDRRRTNPDNFAVPTGFPLLDDLLSGGFKPGELVTVGARPSDGKSALATAFVIAAAANQTPSLLISLEMGRDEICQRMLSMIAGVPLRAIMTSTMTQRESETLVACGLERMPFFIDDRCPQSISRIGSTARRFVRKHGIRLLLVDYVQLIQSPDAKQPRHVQVGAITSGLKQLARSLEIPIVALAQLGRSVEGRSADEPPRLSDLRESGSIEQDCDCAMLLHRREEFELVQNFDLLVLKNRNGARSKVPLLFRRPIVRFESATPR